MGAEAAAGASVCRSGAAETILLLSATMWLHIRTDEGVSAASAPPSAPLPSYCAQRRAAWLRGGAAAGAHASTREEMRRLRLQQQLIPIRSDAAKTPSGTAEFLTAAFSRRASAHSAIRLHQREIGARVKRFYFIFFLHAAVGFQARRAESGAARNERSPVGVGVEHPPRLRLRGPCLPVPSRRLACVGHVGAPVCPRASAEARRHLTGIKWKKCCCQIIGQRADRVTPSRTGFQRGGGVYVRARVCARARPLVSRPAFIFNHVSYPTSARNFISISSD